MIATPTAPQSLQAERAVLAAMLLSTVAIESASVTLEPASFYRPAHGKVFSAIVSLHHRGEPADLVTVTEELRGKGELAAVGGAEYLSGLFEEATTAVNVDAHAKIVAEKALLRRLIKAADDVQEVARAANGGSDAVGIAAEMSAKLKELTASGSARTVILEAVHSTFSLTPEDCKAPVSLLGDGVICSGHMAILAGQPGLGKSHLALELAVAMARGEPWMGLQTAGRPIRALYLALEFANYDWMRRCIRIFGDGYLPDQPAEFLDAFASLQLSSDGGAFLWATRQQLTDDLDFASPQGAASLRHVIEQLGVNIVFCDALSRFMGEREETNEEFGRFVRRMDSVRYPTGCALLFVHHEKKVDDRSKADRLSLVRGGTKLTAGVNTVITVSKSSSGLRTIYFDKANYAKEPEPIRFQIPDEGGPTMLMSEPEKAADKHIETVWSALQAHAGGVMAETLVVETGLAISTVRRHLERLKERGARRVKVDGRTWEWRVEEMG